MLTALVIVSGSCGRSSEGQSGAREGVPVLVAPVVKRAITRQFRAIGTVEAYSTVGVKALVGGEVVAVSFREGQDVKKNQLLFTIDPRPFEAALQLAKANLAKDLAQADKAATDARRWTYLLKEGVGSRQEYEQARATAQALRAAVEADRAEVETARLNLSYTRIYSPIDGRAGNLLLHAGNIVKANADNPMVVINQIVPVYVGFSLPENNLAEVRRYMALRKLEVLATVPGQQDHEQGLLSFVDNSVDQKTGTIQLKGIFGNTSERLWPGQFVNVSLTLGERPNAIVVPSQAVQTGQEGQYVFVVGPGLKAELRHVVAGEDIGGTTVIERGLNQGETVVTDGQLRLVPGARVRIKQSLDGSAGRAT